MRDHSALAILLAITVLAGVGLYLPTSEVAPSEAPNATFTVNGTPADGELTVEHAGGDELPSASLKVLVYEDRPVVPDRTVHATTWRAEPSIRPGDRLVLEDRRFEPGQRLVVRWYGEEGQANLYETVLSRQAAASS